LHGAQFSSISSAVRWAGFGDEQQPTPRLIIVRALSLCCADKTSTGWLLGQVLVSVVIAVAALNGREAIERTPPYTTR
jgi:hypothetical protein